MKTLDYSSVDHLGRGARTVRLFLLTMAGALGSLAIAYLAMTDRIVLAIGAIIAVAILLAVVHRPAAMIAIWLVLVPFVAAAPNASLRKAYWLGHRALPLLALVLLIIGASRRADGTRELGKVGAIEWILGGYLVATVVSVLYTNSDPLPALFLVYDRILIPLVLFLLIVLIDPDEDALRSLVPIIAIVVLGQVVVGVVSWIAPGVLPDTWTRRVGERTIGSLGSPGEYSSFLLTGALLLAHFATRPRRHRLAGGRLGVKRWQAGILIVMAVVMALFTFSRASWVATILVVAGLLVLHPRLAKAAFVAGLVAVTFLTSTGLLDDQLDFASRRFLSDSSEQTALSRLPVAAASVRMLQARPLTGWGYENFDLYDRDFQVEVSGFFPEKDHVSHNVYLTIAAEQGAIGLGLFFAPLLAAAWITRRAWPRLDRLGSDTKKLMVSLWLALAAHVIVNNFADAQTAVGYALWWMTIALIASMGRRAINHSRSRVPA